MKFKKIPGFSLAEILVILLITGIAIVASVTIITKLRSSSGPSQNALDCIFNNAADINFNSTTGAIIEPLPSSGPCYAAYHGCKEDKGNICNTLFYYADIAGDANQKMTALKILRASCDQGGEKACDYFITRCIGNSTNCTSPDSKYTLRYYNNLPTSESNSGRTIIQTKSDQYYSWNMSVFVNEINTACPSCPGDSTTACAVRCN